MTQVVLGGQHNSLGGLPVGRAISCMTGHSIDSALCPIKVLSELAVVCGIMAGIPFQ